MSYFTKINYKTAQLVTPPDNDAIDRQTVKDHLRVVAASQDTLLSIYIKSAISWVENYTSRKLINQTWKVFYDEFPIELFLPFGKVSSLTHIKYYDENDAQQTLSNALYQTDLASVPARVTMKPDQASFPSTKSDKYNAIELQYVVGYGDSHTDIPSDIKHALLLIIGDSFSNREDKSENLSISKSSLHLLSPYRLMEF